MGIETMTKRGMTSALAVVAILAGPGARPGTVAASEPATRPAITEQYVMLYYKDLAASRAFYGDLLGLEPISADDWFALYRVTPSASVGLIKESPDAYHKVRPENSVMLSIVTDDVEAWYARIREHPGIRILKPIYNQTSVPIRAFLIADPGGYTVEFFQWLKP
jgi:catechol 2,3-dioxygenase-like lactoylglutathione lyase family enzyme